MSRIWTIIICVAVVCSIITGRVKELSDSVINGAKASIDLCLAISGMILLWCGVMEVMRRSGLMRRLSRMLQPVIGLLFPSARRSASVMGDLSANVSANLLGLGNAATPAGIRAAQGLQRLSNKPCASDELCMLVIINTASLQLIPTTIAAVRASAGAQNPYDIIPAVWFASAFSQALGITAAIIFSRLRNKRESL